MLAIREKAVGPDHPDVAAALNGLALLHRQQDRNAIAEPLYRRSLAITEKALGSEHPEVASVLENYAVLLRQAGRDREAERLQARALVIRAMQ